MDLEVAFKSFFEHRESYSKLKSKKRTPHAFRPPQNVSVVDDKVSLSTIELVNALIHREMEGTIRSATLKQAPNGHWRLTSVAHVELPDVAKHTANNPAGIDVGLKSFVTLDGGTKIKPPNFYRRAQRKLRRLQRHLSKCHKDSRNRGKAKRQVAKFHVKVKNCRDDSLHKVSSSIVKEHDTICVEDIRTCVRRGGQWRTWAACAHCIPGHHLNFRVGYP